MCSGNWTPSGRRSKKAVSRSRTSSRTYTPRSNLCSPSVWAIRARRSIRPARATTRCWSICTCMCGTNCCISAGGCARFSIGSLPSRSSTRRSCCRVTPIFRWRCLLRSGCGSGRMPRAWWTTCTCSTRRTVLPTRILWGRRRSWRVRQGLRA